MLLVFLSVLEIKLCILNVTCIVGCLIFYCIYGFLIFAL